MPESNRADCIVLTAALTTTRERGAELHSRWYTNSLRDLPWFLRIPGLLFAVLVALVGALHVSTIWPGPQRAELDLRDEAARQDPQGDPWVALCGRGESISGHCFVLIGEGPTVDAIRWNKSFGIYPRAGIGLLGDVPRQLVPESPTRSIDQMTQELVLHLDTEDLARVEGILHRWATPGRFRVYAEDCVTPLQEIAQALGLRVPPRLIDPMPQAWVRALLDLNGTQQP